MTADTDIERWRPVAGGEGYEVSDFGRVKSLRWTPPRILKPGPSNYGHLSVVLGPRNTRMVHQLVLIAFVGPRPPKMEVRHLDGNPANNRLENLCWGTRSDNIRDAIRHGTWHSEKRQVGWRSPATLEARKKGPLARWGKVNEGSRCDV